MARRIPGKKVFNETVQYIHNELKESEIGGKLRIELGTEITYVDMKRLISPYSSTAGRGEGEGSEGMYWWIVATVVEPRIPPIPGLDHTNVLSYIDVLRQDVNAGNRVTIIRAGDIGFSAERWMEDWGG